MKGVWVFFER